MGVFDSRDFRRIMGHYPTGVCVVTATDTAKDGADPIGMVVGAFTSVSLDPPLVAFLPDRRSTTWPRIQAAGHFCVNVLAGDQQAVCRAFSSAAAKRFDAVPYRWSDTGLPVIEGAVAWIDCVLDAVHEAGDHYIAIGAVRALDVERDDAPLVFVKGAYGTVSPCLADRPEVSSPVASTGQGSR